jgi:hypothetical protein
MAANPVPAAAAALGSRDDILNGSVTRGMVAARTAIAIRMSILHSVFGITSRRQPARKE